MQDLLTARREHILRHLVEEYVTTAQPVPSDVIARRYQGIVSPATVRNELAVLEELGLVAHPHTSSGRVPTDRGYRFFVERLMEEGRGLAPEERRSIRHQLHPAARDPGESAHVASAVLARTLRSAAVATPPAAPKPRLRRLELVPLGEDRVLVTLILQSGAVRQSVQRLERGVEREVLARLSNELSERLANRTAGQARRSLGKLADEARALANAAVRLLQQAEEQAFAGIHLEGVTQLLSQPEFALSEKLRPILEVLEHQGLVARLLAESAAGPGVHVIIGAENRLEQMREAALVLTRYGSSDDEVFGVVGVVGPTRLPYWRVVPVVAFMAELLGLLAPNAFGGTDR